MSILDCENIEISFEKMLEECGWTRGVEYFHVDGKRFVKHIHFVHEGMDGYDHSYKIDYCPVGSYFRGVKLRKSICIIQCSIYLYNENGSVRGSWRGIFYIRCSKDQLMNLHRDIRVGFFDPNDYTKVRC